MSKIEKEFWSDRAVMLLICILFVLCVRGFFEVYDAMKGLSNNYDYLNNRINQIEIEMTEHHEKIKHLEKSVFNDFGGIP